jgi:hypothetical protein
MSVMLGAVRRCVKGIPRGFHVDSQWGQMSPSVKLVVEGLPLSLDLDASP